MAQLTIKQYKFLTLLKTINEVYSHIELER